MEQPCALGRTNCPAPGAAGEPSNMWTGGMRKASEAVLAGTRVRSSFPKTPSHLCCWAWGAPFQEPQLGGLGPKPNPKVCNVSCTSAATLGDLGAGLAPGWTSELLLGQQRGAGFLVSGRQGEQRAQPGLPTMWSLRGPFLQGSPTSTPTLPPTPGTAQLPVATFVKSGLAPLLPRPPLVFPFSLVGGQHCPGWSGALCAEGARPRHSAGLQGSDRSPTRPGS